ncbi:MAG: hypothetical protein PWQ54_1352 [Bacteroidales bacterium]|jgi:wyosine [tRNA(Phe)-imidazoG37] synthetase (radical SAM superfamily)|nr:hypothetical protein [Bacteroidales bacterium]
MEVLFFGDMIFGSVKSYRPDVSLEINLLPNHFKFCNFNYIYCEYGWMKKKQALRLELLPKAEVLLIAQEQKLKESAEK